MNLFIDTTTKYVTILTFNQNEILSCVQYEGQNNHTTTIYNELEKVKLNEIKNVYVTSGPGSYTGVRIGVLVAKTIASELKVSLYTINTLKLFKLGLKNEVVLDARGNKYFKFDGSDYSLIKADEITTESIINSHINARWLLERNVITNFTKEDALSVKVDYQKEAI